MYWWQAARAAFASVRASGSFALSRAVLSWFDSTASTSILAPRVEAFTAR
jgi:hypothetical protein